MEQGKLKGPRMVVQKAKHGRKAKTDNVKDGVSDKRNRDTSNNKASRFQALFKESTYDEPHTSNVMGKNPPQDSSQKSWMIEDGSLLNSNKLPSKEPLEKVTNPAGQNALVQKRNRARKNKKLKPFVKHLEIYTKGINKGKDKEQGREKT